jgi:hypothetical protein
MGTKSDSVYLSLLKKLLFFSLMLGSIATVLFFVLPSKLITPALPFLFPFFISVTLISSYLLIRSSQKKFIKYLNVYLLTTVSRLFLYIAVMVTYIMLNRADILPFSISFLILYLCYTIFEVVWLVSFSRVDKPE